MSTNTKQTYDQFYKVSLNVKKELHQTNKYPIFSNKKSQECQHTNDFLVSEDEQREKIPLKTFSVHLITPSFQSAICKTTFKMQDETIKESQFTTENPSAQLSETCNYGLKGQSSVSNFSLGFTKVFKIL